MSPLETKSGRAAVIDAPASRLLEKDGAEFKRDVGFKDAAPSVAATPLLLDLIPLHRRDAVDATGRPIGKAPLQSGWPKQRLRPMSRGG